MFNIDFRIPQLLAGHFSNALSDLEEEELKLWINASSENLLYYNQFKDEQVIANKLQQFQELSDEMEVVVWNKTLQKLGDVHPQNEIPNLDKKVKKLWARIAVAAAIALVVGTLAILLNVFQHPRTKQNLVATDGYNDIAAVKTAATLTLANGRKIILSNAANGKLATEAGVSISKTTDGQLIYSVIPTENDNGNSFNTLLTANGEQYQIILPDQTRAWLNAASSITYPTSFANTKRREVTIKGEIYFEVAKDKVHPFIVKTNTQSIQVMGTHFNVNSYDNEPVVKTTLLEGAVTVFTNKDKVILKPMQESINRGGKLAVEDADDADEAIAWKKGYLQFNDENLESVMRKISRWYDVEIVFVGKPGNQKFNGIISRSKGLKSAIKIIEAAGNVNFKMEGRKLFVKT
ncbi:FecR family protein [Pedobacter sp. MC2016-14]|uniref:FecR family protein n=1 Tax=Pedobacter sp. MC2016-14 TaxID=2897327 RepID=UPI001E44669A|nr:FecR family protein [Pedobacter sp. MC2016-14]MCD0490071.1 FecR family protein [Pedobacter sp. MC2016-14]